MNYKEIKPNGFLSSFVQCFWYYETEATAVNHTILPDGYFELIAAFEYKALTQVNLPEFGQKKFRSQKTPLFLPSDSNYWHSNIFSILKKFHKKQEALKKFRTVKFRCWTLNENL
ncbi:DUF6597 domain-containing transcriptional factor [Flavobacterium foetidum]|uniref:DUF6597 domain-containing transcriptional factor n=1 Tax=Flavobacterium foetidum TaxID=2026681 RepID=UPI001ABFD016|nr:DUF6597 domain-containing transcriptional factor [Flavobacterium foetidum]